MSDDMTRELEELDAQKNRLMEKQEEMLQGMAEQLGFSTSHSRDLLADLFCQVEGLVNTLGGAEEFARALVTLDGDPDQLTSLGSIIPELLDRLNGSRTSREASS